MIGSNPSPKTQGLVLAALICALAAPAALAASPCKGLQQQACEGNKDCAWVHAYTKKDGKQVAGYCRSAHGSAAAAGAAGTKPTTKPPATAPSASTPYRSSTPATTPYKYVPPSTQSKTPAAPPASK